MFPKAFLSEITEYGVSTSSQLNVRDERIKVCDALIEGAVRTHMMASRTRENIRGLTKAYGQFEHNVITGRFMKTATMTTMLFDETRFVSLIHFQQPVAVIVFWQSRVWEKHRAQVVTLRDIRLVRNDYVWLGILQRRGENGRRRCALWRRTIV
jgi:hypothetical protein